MTDKRLNILISFAKWTITAVLTIATAWIAADTRCVSKDKPHHPSTRSTTP
jgi:hypothetical protein